MNFKFYINQSNSVFAVVEEPSGVFGNFLDGEFNAYSKEVDKFLTEVRRVKNGDQESCGWGGMAHEAYVTQEYASIESVFSESPECKVTVPTADFMEVLEKWHDFLARNSQRDRKERGEI